MPKGKKQNSIPDKETKPHKIPDTDRDFIKKIAARAKELRVESGFTYEEFAIHAGINRNSYFRLEKKSAETGENFTIALLLKVIRGLGLTISEFMKDIQ